MPKYSSLQVVQQSISEGKINCSELVDYYLSQIESASHLNAYVEVFGKEAKEQAIFLDEKYLEDPNSVGKL